MVKAQHKCLKVKTESSEEPFLCFVLFFVFFSMRIYCTDVAEQKKTRKNYFSALDKVFIGLGITLIFKFNLRIMIFNISMR